MNDILIPDKFSLDGIAPNMIEVKKLDKALLTIHADGRITVSEDLKPTETAAEVLKIMQDMWLSNQQVVKIRELQEKIKRLEEAGDGLCCGGVNMSWNDRVDNWHKAKEAKP